MLNKQAKRFMKRKSVTDILGNIELSDIQIVRLNAIFENRTCKSLETWHVAIATFIKYDLTNYVGRLRRLMKISTTRSGYSMFLRYGKENFEQIKRGHDKKRSKHFKNTITYWTDMGIDAKEAIIKVREIQVERNKKAVEKTRGTNVYTHRSVEYWKRIGFSEYDAAERVRKVQTTDGLKFYTEKYGEDLGTTLFKNRIESWLDTLQSKTIDEVTLINRKKSLSIDGYMLRGYSEDAAINAYVAMCDRMRVIDRSPFSKISQKLFSTLREKLIGTCYFKPDTHEALVGGYRVDFYHLESKTVIEFYGDYWHRNPLFFTAESSGHGYISKEKWISDSNREMKIKEDMARVSKFLIIWENEYRQRPDEVITTILENIGANYVR